MKIEDLPFDIKEENMQTQKAFQSFQAENKIKSVPWTNPIIWHPWGCVTTLQRGRRKNTKTSFTWRRKRD